MTLNTYLRELGQKVIFRDDETLMCGVAAGGLFALLLGMGVVISYDNYVSLSLDKSYCNVLRENRNIGPHTNIPCGEVELKLDEAYWFMSK